MQTVAEMPTFIKQADKLFSPEERVSVINFISAYAELGDIIKGTGGVRKLRVPAKGKGKSGGARIILYYLDENAPIYALMIYPKDAKISLSAKEKKIVSSLAKALKTAHRR